MDEPDNGSGTRQRQCWLLGQSPLGDYLTFVEDAVCNGSAMPRSELVDAWRAANDHYAELEQAEAGFADDIDDFPLESALQPLAEDVMADRRFRHTFDTLPTDFAMVELDRLIVAQSHVTVDHTDRLKAVLGSSPTPQDLFRFCLPLDRDEAPVHCRKTGSRSYQFWSNSADFRFQGPVLLAPGQVRDHETFGPVSSLLGLSVGFGSNLFCAIEFEGRMVIHNGHHRAHALRAMGFTHAPCIVQRATRLDELKIAASRSVLDDPAFYFRAARPPVLKDFFDPKIGKNHWVNREVRVVEIRFEIEQYQVKDFVSEP